MTTINNAKIAYYATFDSGLMDKYGNIYPIQTLTSNNTDYTQSKPDFNIVDPEFYTFLKKWKLGNPPKPAPITPKRVWTIINKGKVK